MGSMRSEQERMLREVERRLTDQAQRRRVGSSAPASCCRGGRACSAKWIELASTIHASRGSGRERAADRLALYRDETLRRRGGDSDSLPAPKEARPRKGAREAVTRWQLRSQRGSRSPYPSFGCISLAGPQTLPWR